MNDLAQTIAENTAHEVAEEITASAPVAVTNIPSTNPTSEEAEAMCEAVESEFSSPIFCKMVPFSFKVSTTKDDTGKVIAKSKRETLNLPIPFPTTDGIISILETGGKELELLMEAMYSVVTKVARDMISEDQAINASNIGLEKLAWATIAAMPKAERGGGIPKELWEGFATDYIATMVEATGKPADKVARAAKLLTGKFAAVKTNLEVIEALTGFLAVYMDNTKNAEKYMPCVEFLINKADALMNADPASLLDNL